MLFVRKWFAITALIAMFGVVLAACGAPATTTTTNEGTAATTVVESAPAAAAEITAPAASGDKVTLTIESWRNDDLTIWQDKIIPAFEAKNPNIKVVFQPSAPLEYDAALNTKLQGGTAGDLITCRPFDVSLSLFDNGYLAPLTDLKGLENFGDSAKSGWITDDGKTIYCVPMASVIHGFIYNQEAFDKLGLKEPTTEDEFFAMLDTIKADGTYVPLAMGTSDQWETAAMGFHNIGPNYWKGEEGRKALIAGTAKFTDAPYVDTWTTLARWKDYLPVGHEAVKYPDSQSLFTLGKAAIYPAGSWEISVFNSQAQFKMGAFKPPVKNAGDQCYISDHTDIAMGMNPKTAHPAETKIFLEWMTTAEFAELYSNALPGFFSLSNSKVTLTDPLAQTFADWRSECKTTIRVSYQILSRGEPNLDQDIYSNNVKLLTGQQTPEQAAQAVETNLEKWYKPAP